MKLNNLDLRCFTVLANTMKYGEGVLHNIIFTNSHSGEVTAFHRICLKLHFYRATIPASGGGGGVWSIF